MIQSTHKILFTGVQRDFKKFLLNPKNNGFTLLEVLVAVFMVGILGAIIAPSWLNFVKQQQVNKVNDIVLAALQKAQREAKKNKLNYSVSFRINSGSPEISVYSGSTPNWESLTGDLGINTGDFILGTNLNATNTLASPANVAFNNLSTAKTITFDYMGALASKSNGSASDTGIKIVVAIPQYVNSTNPSNSRKCVIIETLIGGMRTAKNNGCN